MTKSLFFMSSLIIALPLFSAEKPISLTVEEYVKIVMKQGEAALKAYNNFENSQLSYKISYRNARLPKASASADVSRSRSQTAADVTYDRESSRSLSLTQPFYPTGASISGSVSDSIGQSESAGVISDTFSNPAYAASLTQPVPLLKGISSLREWRRSRYTYQGALESYAVDLIGIENSARSKYYDVLRAGEELDAAKIKLKASYRSYQITQALVDAGRYAGIELSRAEVRYQGDVRGLKNAETNLKKVISDALDAASLPPTAKVQFTSKLDYQPLQVSLERLIQFALMHRPDYLAAKRNLELSELSLKETLESNNPDVKMTGSYSRKFGGHGSPQVKNAQGAISVEWPFFDSRVTHLQAEQARNSLENEKISFRSLERGLVYEVTNAYDALKTQEEQIQDVRKSRDQARQDIEVVRIRYKNGRDRLIDVFSSEDELSNLEKEYLDVIIGANTKRDALAVTIGGRLSEVVR